MAKNDIRNEMPVNTIIQRSVILVTIEEHLAQMTAWAASSHYETALQYRAKAEALIEILEMDDCGSTGGFDIKRGQDKERKTRIGGLTLPQRLDWLKKIS